MEIKSILLFIIVAAASSFAAAQQNTATAFKPGRIWPDSNGLHINAHGGGILYYNQTYYWFGEHKVAGRRGNTAQVGVSCYSSKDLYNWKNEGIALAVSEESESEITQGCIIERPKVAYNQKTNKFVMWFHLELKGRDYEAARCGIAVSDSVAGPYTYLKSLRPDAGFWPTNVRLEQKNAQKNNLLQRDFEGGQQSRDMTIFVDDDGKAYHIYASEKNQTMHISLLADDYLSHAGKYVRVFENRSMEAPAMFKNDGKYYIICSGCTGWAPNTARSAVADSVWGPYKELGNPCTGAAPTGDAQLTFGGQSTFIIPVQGKKDAFIAMFDIWRPRNQIDSRYVWLPIQFEKEGFIIHWMDQWDLSFFDK